MLASAFPPADDGPKDVRLESLTYAVAQAAAQDEIDTLAADVTLADEQASENADFVNTETPQSDQESATLEQEGDTHSSSTVNSRRDRQSRLWPGIIV